MKEINLLKKSHIITGGIINPNIMTEEQWNNHYNWGLEHPGIIGPPRHEWPIKSR